MENNISLDRLYKLINVNLTVNDNFDDFEVVLQRLLHAIEVITNSEVTSLLAFDNNKKNLYFRYGTGSTSHDLIGLKVPYGKGIAHTVAKSKKGVIVNDLQKSAHYTTIDKKLNYKTKRLMAYPILDNMGEVFAIVEACNKKNDEDYNQDDFQILGIFCQQAEKAIIHALYIHSLKKRIKQLVNMIEEVNTPPIQYTSKDMRNIVTMIAKVSVSDTSILLTGDVGTGKTLIAQHIHKQSRRNIYPVVQIDCHQIVASSNTEEEVGMVLWGGNRDTKTGIRSPQKGLFTKGKAGTIILKNIEFLPLKIQRELLELLRHKLYTPMYADDSQKLDVRVICTTTQDLNVLVEEGKFEEELFFYINSLSFHINPLKDRKEDIFPIAKYYLHKYIENFRKNLTIDPGVYTILKNYNWPYNMHSLLNVLEYLVLSCESDTLTSEFAGKCIFNLIGGGQSDLVADDIDISEDVLTLHEAVNQFKTKYIHQVLLQNNWNHTKTAGKLDIQRSYLSRLVKEYKLKYKQL